MNLKFSCFSAAALAFAPPLIAATAPVVNETAPVSIPAVGSENDVSVGDALLTQGTVILRLLDDPQNRRSLKP